MTMQLAFYHDDSAVREAMQRTISAECDRDGSKNGAEWEGAIKGQLAAVQAERALGDGFQWACIGSMPSSLKSKR